MEVNDEFLLKQGELEEEIGISVLNVTPEHWQDMKWKIKLIPGENGEDQIDFELNSQEGHEDPIQLSQELIDKSIELYNLCVQNNNMWEEATIRIYIHKKTDKWKCVGSYKYE